MLIQLSVLACLEEDTGASTYDLFDMIAGSSSGGLITCLILGRRISAGQIIQMALQEKLLEKMMAEHWLHRLSILANRKAQHYKLNWQIYGFRR